MKCENCGKNEVTFVYQSNINGHVTEKHLCAECSEKLGYSQRIAAHSRRMMQNFFDGGFFGGSLLDSFFGNRLLDGSAGIPGELFDDFFQDMPALSAPAAEPEAPRQQTLVEKEDESYFSYLRHVNALKAEMKKAVRKEDFERAAQLRDELHDLEAEHKARKEEN